MSCGPSPGQRERPFSRGRGCGPAEALGCLQGGGEGPAGIDGPDRRALRRDEIRWLARAHDVKIARKNTLEGTVTGETPLHPPLWA